MSEITKKSDQQIGAEAEVESFRKDLGPFVVAAETTRMAMVFTDATKPDNPIIFAKTGAGRQGTPAHRSIAYSIGTRLRLVVQPPSFCDRGVFRSREGERPCGAMHDHREGTDIWSPTKSVTGTVVVTWAIPIGVRR